MSRPVRPVLERLLERVSIDVDGCWIAGFAPRDHGYCYVNVPGEDGWVPEAAHRVMWVNEHGPIPAGFDVHHRCEVRACCCPEHLELREHAAHALGHARRSLADADVEAIRAAVAGGASLRSMAREYGCHHKTVSRALAA